MTDVYPEVDPLTGRFVSPLVHDRYRPRDAPPAAPDVLGAIRLAGDLEGSPEAPTVKTATESRAGKVALATDAQAMTGTDASLAVTPRGVAQALTTKADRQHAHAIADVADAIAEPEILFAITDEDGRRTDLELGQDGTLTDRVVIGLAPRVITQGQSAIEAAMGVPNLSGDATGVIYAVVDEDERVTDIELGRDGRFTDRVMASISSRVAPTAASYRATYETAAAPVVSGPDIALWGDSLTAGGGWDSLLSGATGRGVWRCGVGGETSAGIAARQGGMPYLMIAAGGAIPASGPVDVTLTSSGGGVTWPLLQGAGTANGYADGVLCGVPGRLTLIKGTTPLPSHGNDDRYVFTRTSAGAAVPCDRPSPFYWANGVARAWSVPEKVEA